MFDVPTLILNSNSNCTPEKGGAYWGAYRGAYPAWGVHHRISASSNSNSNSYSNSLSHLCPTVSKDSSACMVKSRQPLAIGHFKSNRSVLGATYSQDQCLSESEVGRTRRTHLTELQPLLWNFWQYLGSHGAHLSETEKQTCASGLPSHACPTAASLGDLKRQELVFCEHVSLAAFHGSAAVAFGAGG